MAALHETVFYDVQDCKMWVMVADAGSASPTYGAAIDVPGISAVSVDPTIVSNALKGDGKVMARRAKIDEFAWSMTYGKASLDVLAAAFGGQVTDAGSGGAEHAHWRLKLPIGLATFAMRWVITDVDVGLEALILTLYKSKISGGTLFGSSSDTYGQPTMQGTGIQPEHDVDDITGATVFQDYTPTIDVALYEDIPNVSLLP